MICHQSRLVALTSLCIASALTLTIAHAGDQSAYETARVDARRSYDLDIEKCQALANTAKDLCKAQAKQALVRKEAAAEAKKKGTDTAAYDARIDIAKADFAVGKAKCAELSGTDKDTCLKQAELTYTQAKSAAKKKLDARELWSDTDAAAQPAAK